MRMNNRTMFRKYVRNADIGNAAVNEIWHGDTMIYPDNETLVKQLTVSVPAVGTLEWAYWVHAVRGVTSRSSLYRKTAQLMLTAGGESWWCGDNRPTGLYRCSITEDGVLAFGTDQGPVAQDVNKGDTVTLKAVIPLTGDNPLQSYVQDASTNMEWTNPWLPGSKLYLQWGKGQKKKSAGVVYKLTGVSSGMQMLAGSGQKNGHGRGELVSGYATPAACRVVNHNNSKSGDDAYVAGDTGIKGFFQQYNSCYYLYSCPMYPAFTKSFSLTVKNVLTQSNS